MRITPGLQLLFFLTVSLSASSQKVFFSEPQKKDSIQRTVPLGKAGTNFLLLQQDQSQPEIWAVNTQVNFISKKSSPLAPSAASTQFFQGENLAIIQELNHGDQAKVRVAILSETGDVVSKKEIQIKKIVSTETGRADALLMASSANGNYHVFYQCIAGIVIDSLLFKGTIVNKNWEKIKEVSFLIPFDKELDEFIGVLPDEKGGIHLATADQHSNFRLSTRVRIHTIDVQKELMTSDEVTIKSRKLKYFILEENTQTGNLELKGAYVDGKTKNASGLFFLTAPLKRGMQVKPDFYAFDEKLVKGLLKEHKGAKADELMNELVLLGASKSKKVYNIFSVLPQATIPFASYARQNVPQSNADFTAFSNNIREKGLSVSGPSGEQKGLPPLSANPNVPTGLRDLSQKKQLPLRLDQSTFSIAQVVAFRFNEHNGLQSLEWGKLQMENRTTNNLLLVNQDSSVFITYLADEYSVPVLSRVQFGEEGNVTSSPIKLDKPYKLLLSEARKLDEKTYFVPYEHEKTGETGFCFLSL